MYLKCIERFAGTAGGGGSGGMGGGVGGAAGGVNGGSAGGVWVSVFLTAGSKFACPQSWGCEWVRVGKGKGGVNGAY